ncbi:MAG: hypothetical protein KDC75_13215 [Phaeodactylibacter sp.]|nr:hypothetical protein [Saprospiraceae bacterium]MCB0614271.1 hypothetical protein [Phaeodactylibacter sp.]MCB9342820.1 hypothetical protein [Lewinellaceae bacterium]
MITTEATGREITKLQKRFVSIFNSKKPERIEAIVGSPGGAFKATFLYFKQFNFWAVFDNTGTRYWNAFGTGKPIAGKNNSITCEINFPFDGIERRVAGVFGRESDKVLLLHRGRIGGGRKGIGKSLFFDNYRGAYEVIQDGDQENTLALIGSLDSKYFVQQIASFIFEVQRIKDLIEPTLENAGDDDAEDSSFNYEFKEEGFGKRRYSRKDEIEAESYHGIIVNALADKLAERGFVVGNDRKRDLYTIRDNRIDRIFEAKTALTNSSIYSAIGQVLFYSSEKGLDNNQKILVLPEKLKASAEKIIQRLGLQILYYSFQGKVVRFIDLDGVLNKK